VVGFWALYPGDLLLKSVFVFFSMCDILGSPSEQQIAPDACAWSVHNWFFHGAVFSRSTPGCPPFPPFTCCYMSLLFGCGTFVVFFSPPFAGRVLSFFDFAPLGSWLFFKVAGFPFSVPMIVPG